jgi:hypothetical protein
VIWFEGRWSWTSEDRMKNYPQVTVRMDPTIKAAAMKRAAAERRSFAAEVEHLLAIELERSGYLPAREPAEAP